MSTRPAAPQETLIEKGVLASVFDDVDMIGFVAEILSPEDFSEPKHELIYRTVLDFYQRNEQFDLLKVAQKLSNDGDLGKVGGVPYLSEIVDPDTIYSNTDPVGYALMVLENSIRRQLDIYGNSVAEKTLPGSGYDVDSTIAYAQENLQKLAQIGSGQSDVKRAGDLIEDAFAEIEYKSTIDDSIAIGVRSGFVDLDDMTTGFAPAQMIILGGRPAMGKTSVVLDMVRASTLLAGKTTIFFSLEMGKGEVMQKILSAHAHIEFEKIKKGNVNAEEWERLREAAKEIKESNLLIDDTPELSLVNLRTKCLKQKARPEGLDMVVIDYLQLMAVPKVSASDGRQTAVSALSRGVKLLAKELGVPIIILSQLSREVEKRNDKTPLMSDLRESGSLEQDADIVMFIHRPEYYDPNDRPGQALLIIAKHRVGRTGAVTLIPLLEYSKFANGAGKFAPEAPDDPETIPPDMDDPFGSVDSTPEPPSGYDDVYPQYGSEDSPPADPDEGGSAW
jgi:replicative DNA helicase